ncbi:hypothetical protein FHL15_004208 [Xylaria flabelliformis]|uniref:BRCT domain-containing protein n=1 Tax=Xylaria flabelliformis TaxID=2512241 RepID=A0A553I3G5_9PEZI|nr:hypothetical protein FHL15_004208 [Xylaria flabelliformis]
MPSNLIFKDCVVSIAGDLDDYDWREEKVKQWVQYWGGTFSPIVDDNVTHLLCTRGNFKKNIAAVRAALKNRQTKIVMRDWLEDSINKQRRLKTLPYQLDEEARQEEAKKRRIQKMEACSKNAIDYVDERYWHVYRDCTNFQYQIQLKRDDKESGNIGEKHLLTLWESNAKPSNYRCTTLFTKKSKNKAIRYPLNETPVDLKTGLKTFETFFRKKTSIKWDDRMEKMGTTGPEHFQYQPPSGGKPVGLLKGRRASLFGEDDRVSTPSQTSNEGQHNYLEKDKKPVEIYHKRAREGNHFSDDAIVNAEGEGRPAKKSRLEAAETVRHVSPKPKDDSASESRVADSRSDSKSESREDVRGVEVVSEEVMQDLDGANEAQYPLELNNIVDNGISERVDDDEFPPEDELADESDDPTDTNDDGVAAPCNSEADDEEFEYEGEDAEVSDEPRENTEQEAEEISRMYDEVQYAETDDDGEDHANDDDDDDDDDEYSLEAIRARRLAREISATAASIYYESQRGVALVQDSQAALIDGVRAREAYICAQGERTREREEMEDAEDLEEEKRIDRQIAFFGLGDSMDY